MEEIEVGEEQTAKQPVNLDTADGLGMRAKCYTLFVCIK